MIIGPTVLFPLTFASNAFVATTTMPSWLRSFVEVNPISHLVTVERGLMIGTATAALIIWVLAASMLFTAVFAPLTMRLYCDKGLMPACSVCVYAMMYRVPSPRRAGSGTGSPHRRANPKRSAGCRALSANPSAGSARSSSNSAPRHGHCDTVGSGWRRGRKERFVAVGTKAHEEIGEISPVPAWSST